MNAQFALISKRKSLGRGVQATFFNKLPIDELRWNNPIEASRISELFCSRLLIGVPRLRFR